MGMAAAPVVGSTSCPVCSSFVPGFISAPSSKRLTEIGDDVCRVFDASGEPEQPVIDTRGEPVVQSLPGWVLRAGVVITVDWPGAGC